MLLQRFDRLPYPNLESELSGESLQQLVDELPFGRTSCMLEPVSVNAAGAEAGGMADTHQGGRQFASQDDADWKNMEAWVRGQKAAGSSTA